VNQVEVIHAFRPVREDLDRMPKGIALLEVSDQMARTPSRPRLYSMLVGALTAWPTCTSTRRWWRRRSS